MIFRHLLIAAAALKRLCASRQLIRCMAATRNAAISVTNASRPEGWGTCAGLSEAQGNATRVISAITALQPCASRHSAHDFCRTNSMI